jgi:hypothetical protein
MEKIKKLNRPYYYALEHHFKDFEKDCILACDFSLP